MSISEITVKLESMHALDLLLAKHNLHVHAGQIFDQHGVAVCQVLFSASGPVLYTVNTCVAIHLIWLAS